MVSLEELLGELVRRSLGELERAVVASQDGLVVAASNPSEIDDVIAALSAAVIAGCDEAFRRYMSSGVGEVVVELRDGRRALIREVGGAVLCLVTRENPNLGLVYYLLDKYAHRIAAGFGEARRAEGA